MATTATVYKTPGVFIKELNAFPDTIPGVATAVPAFIGYTEKATWSGQSVLNKPIPIASMAEFQLYFGNPPTPQYNVIHWTDTPPVPGQRPDFDVPYAGTTLHYLLESKALKHSLYYCMDLYFANGGGPCWVVSVGTYSDKVDKDALETGLTVIANQTGPTMLVVPEAIYLEPDSVADGQTPPLVPTSAKFQEIVQKMIEQSVDLQDRVAVLDVYAADQVTQENVGQTLNPCTDQFREALTPLLSIPNALSYGAAYFPWLNTTIVDSGEINYTNFSRTEAPIALTPALSPAPQTEIQEVLTLFNLQKNPGADNTTYPLVQVVIDDLFTDGKLDATTVTLRNNMLMNALPQYANLLNVVASKINVLPASPAMAGLYCLNDANRGVWNAPANMALFSVTSPTVSITDTHQEHLNAPLSGDAVDAIRAFPGRGTIVWGARTLEANSLDWRYIQVRRTIIYIEQSIKLAMNPHVFAPNDSTTWNAVTASISGFLQTLWSQGGLMGDKAAEAFSVQCGLASTMTGTDVLNGLMIVQVTLQMIHPAEFIELRFTQKMQGV